MATFKHSFCDPLNPKIVELGDIDGSEVISKFENTDWDGYLKRMDEAEQNKIFYSPSVQLVNKETNHGLELSAVGTPGNYVFYIFYKRPKLRKLLGLFERLDKTFTTDVVDISHEDALKAVTALANGDYVYLDSAIA